MPENNLTFRQDTHTWVFTLYLPNENRNIVIKAYTLAQIEHRLKEYNMGLAGFNRMRDQVKKAESPKTVKTDFDQFTKKELVEMLGEASIDADPKMKKAELVALAEEHLQ